MTLGRSQWVGGSGGIRGAWKRTTRGRLHSAAHDCGSLRSKSAAIRNAHCLHEKIQERAFRLIADVGTRLERLHSCFPGQYLRPALSSTDFAALRWVTTFDMHETVCRTRQGQTYGELVRSRPIPPSSPAQALANPKLSEKGSLCRLFIYYGTNMYRRANQLIR
jgi:hypothetical protein